MSELGGSLYLFFVANTSCFFKKDTSQRWTVWWKRKTKKKKWWKKQMEKKKWEKDKGETKAS